MIRYNGFSDDNFSRFERRLNSKYNNLVNLVTIIAMQIHILENLNTQQNDWNFIELLYFQTEYCFMQRDESNNGKREWKIPRMIRKSHHV